MQIPDDVQRQCRNGIRAILADDPRRMQQQLAIFEMTVQLGERHPPGRQLWWPWGGPPKPGDLAYPKLPR